jgi:hypothetical protein
MLGYLGMSSSPASSSSDSAMQLQLAKKSLAALPAGLAMLSLSSSSAKGKKKKGPRAKLTRLASEGQPIGVFFNAVAGRPYPNFVKLEQSITVVDIVSTQAFITTSATVPQYGTLALTLSSFPNVTEYTNLFDQYKIEQIECWLEASGSQEAVYEELVTCVDLDDANTPTSVASIQDKQGALVGNGTAGRYHRWKPHVAVAEFAGTFTGYGNMPSTWIDTASPAVQHYGFKAAAAPGGTVVAYNLTVRAVISFRAPGL